VLLWHNVWEIEAPGPDVGLIHHGDGPALGAFGNPMLDPTAPLFRERLCDLMVRLLAPPPRGYGADGLKLDIIHSTPSGPGYRLGWHEGQRSDQPDDTAGRYPWGNGLLHCLLVETYRAAKEVRQDALVESHAVNPLFRDTLDVLRLNDVFTDRVSVVDEMRHRARVARAVGFATIDTDCWRMPSRAALLEYVEAQPELGIPDLYYATRVDGSGERLRERDYRQIAAVWARYRRGLSS
jgi:hypothetical protein